MASPFQRSEFWFKIALLVFFGALYAAAIPYPEQSRQFPQLLAIASFVMTAVALAMDFRGVHASGARGEISGVDDTELTVLDAAERKARTRRYFQAWTIILVAAGAGVLGGFLFSTIILFAGFAFFFGERRVLVRNLVAGGVMTLVVYLVFSVLMGVPLLSGALW